MTSTTRSAYLWCHLHLDTGRISLLSLLEHSLPSFAQSQRELRIFGEKPLGGDDGNVVLRLVDPVAQIDEKHLFSTALAATEWAYGAVHNAVMEESRARGWQRLHAGLIELDGTRVLIAGPSGRGKTSLVLALGLHGARVHSDEGVFIRNGAVVGLPRRLHVRDSSRSLFPPGAFDDAVTLPYEDPLHAIDPGIFPGAKRAHESFTSEPLVPLHLTDRDAVILLGERDCPGLRLDRVPPSEALWELLPEAEPLAADRAALVRETAVLLGTAPVYRLQGFAGMSGREAVQRLAEHGRTTV